MGFERVVGSFATSGTALSTFSVTVPTTAIAVGRFVIVAVSHHSGTGITSVTDSAGNTYQLDAQIARTTTMLTSIYSAKVTTQIAVSGTISANMSTGRNGAIAVIEASGLDPTTWKDKSAAAAGSSNDPKSGPTAALAQAQNLVVGAVGVSGSYAYTNPAGWTEDAELASVTTVRALIMEHIEVNSTTGVEAGGTFAASEVWTAAVVAYKLAATATTVTKNYTAGVATQTTTDKDYTAGVATVATATKTYTAGVATLTTATKTYTAGVATVTTTDKNYTAGVATVAVGAVEKNYTAGVSVSGSSTKPYTAGVATAIVTDKAYTIGVATLVSVDKSYTAGVATSGSVTKAYTAGVAVTTLDNTKPYTAGVATNFQSTKNYTAGVAVKGTTDANYTAGVALAPRALILPEPVLPGGTPSYTIWVYGPSGQRYGTISLFESLEVVRTKHEAGSMVLTVVEGQYPVHYFRENNRYIIVRSVAGQPSTIIGKTMWIGRRFRYNGFSSNARVTVHAMSAVGLLADREILGYAGGAIAQASGTIDDIMKKIVTDAFMDTTPEIVNPTAFARRASADWLTIDAAQGVGPTTTRSFAFRNVLDTLHDLADESVELGTPVSFDMQLAPDGQRLRFLTARGPIGTPRNLTVAEGFGNLGPDAEMEIDYEGVVSTVFIGGNGEETQRAFTYLEQPERYGGSQLGYRERFVDGKTSGDIASLLVMYARGREVLGAGRARARFTGTLLQRENSVFGVNWDWGDVLNVEYGGFEVDCELTSLRVTVGDGGETVEAKLQGEVLL